MSGTQSAEDLERELVDAPERFDAEGKAYVLLQHYFAGRSLEHLSPHLRSGQPLVKRAVMFVLSELGRQAEPIVEEVLPLARDDDRKVRYLALEVIAVCAEGPKAALVTEIGRAIEDTDPVISRLAMRLLARLELTQLEAAYEHLRTRGGLSRSHVEGFARLVGRDVIDAGTVEAMLTSASPVSKRYAAVVLARMSDRFPGLAKALVYSEDEVVRKFAAEMRVS